MTFRDQTNMGGNQSAFLTTHWSVILEARTYDEARQREMLNQLAGRYWKPVYCYLRRKGCSDDEAKDLTQDFFATIVLGRDLVQQANPGKGRFRTFLLTALDRYVISQRRALGRKKRSPKNPLLSLEVFEECCLTPQSEEMEPQELFTYVWASALLDEILAEVQQGCLHEDKQVHWELFRGRVLEPIINGGSPPALRELCRRLGVADETKAANMIVTVKRRFQVAMRQRMRQYVDSEDEVDDEIRDLMQILAQGRAG